MDMTVEMATSARHSQKVKLSRLFGLFGFYWLRPKRIRVGSESSLSPDRQPVNPAFSEFADSPTNPTRHDQLNRSEWTLSWRALGLSLILTIVGEHKHLEHNHAMVIRRLGVKRYSLSV